MKDIRFEDKIGRPQQQCHFSMVPKYELPAFCESVRECLPDTNHNQIVVN